MQARLTPLPRHCNGHFATFSPCSTHCSDVHVIINSKRVAPVSERLFLCRKPTAQVPSCRRFFLYPVMRKCVVLHVILYKLFTCELLAKRNARCVCFVVRCFVADDALACEDRAVSRQVSSCYASICRRPSRKSRTTRSPAGKLCFAPVNTGSNSVSSSCSEPMDGQPK